MKNLLLVFLKASWSFFRPPEKKILIYDREGSKILLNFFNKNNYYILETRGENINFYVLIKTLLKSGFVNFKNNYKKNFFKIVNPKYVFSLVDNNPAFYFLKEYTNAITVFVQSSYRNEKELSLQHLQDRNLKPEVDYMCVFGNVIGKEYTKVVKGKYLVTGNLINNSFQETVFEKNTLVFISQFKSGRIFPKNEKILLKILKQFCKNKSLKFFVSTKVLENDINGFLEYEKILGKNDWHYFPRKNLTTSYEIMLKSEYIVFADSTLGYEALSRGKKILSLAFGSNMPIWCKKNCAHEIIPFGYPLKLPPEGPFWLNYFSKKKIYQKLDDMITKSENAWKSELDLFATDNLIIYDHKNTIFLTLLKKLKIL